MPKNVSIAGPLDSNGAIPINVHDQHTEMVVLPLYIEINSGQLLNASTVIDSNLVTLKAGHGATAGKILTIRGPVHVYAGGILSITDNVATMDSPLDHVFDTSSDVVVGNTNLNAVGSIGSPITATVGPPSGVDWDITRLHVSITDEVVMDSEKFGGITALTNGMVLRTFDGHIKNIANVKTNGDLTLVASDHAYEDKAPAGVYNFISKHIFGGQDHVGVVIRLYGASNDALQVIIQDNLSALTAVKVVAIGHTVTD